MSFASNKTRKIYSADLSAPGTFAGDSASVPAGVRFLTVQAKFVRAGGGTTTKVYIQTSFDEGVTWVDIMCLAFATTTATKISSTRVTTAVAAAYVPTDATMTDDTIKDGIIGDRIRAKVVVDGTYTGASSVEVSASCG